MPRCEVRRVARGEHRNLDGLGAGAKVPERLGQQSLAICLSSPCTS